MQKFLENGFAHHQKSKQYTLRIYGLIKISPEIAAHLQKFLFVQIVAK